MLKRDTDLRRIRLIGWLWVVFGLVELVLGWLTRGQNSSWALQTAFAGLIIVGGLATGIFGPLAFRRLARLREDVAQGRTIGVPLAQPQPIPNPDAMSVPTNLTTRLRWGVMLILVAVLVPIYGVAIFVGVVVASYSRPTASVAHAHAVHHAVSLLVFVIVLTVPIVILMAVMALILWLTVRQRITVTQDALSVYRAWRTRRIRWDEARLFAIDFGTKKRRLPTMYELSGPREMVRWLRYWHGWHTSMARPANMTWDEYEQTMDRLLSVIAGRTGLPLYDLRKHHGEAAPPINTPEREPAPAS